MTLKTSSRKINPFTNMITFTLRKSIGIIIILCIAALLFCPGSYIKNFDSNYNAYGNLLPENSISMIDGFANFLSVFAVIITIGFNVINFGFLYKKSSSDVFHAFPLTRTEMLISRALAGLFSTLIPLTLCYVSYGVMIAFYSWMGSFLQLLYYFLNTVIIMILCSAFSLIFIISAGSTFDLGVSFIGANIALIVVSYIFNLILSQTLLGYTGSIFSDIVYYISPLYFCIIGIQQAGNIHHGISSGSIMFLILSVVYIAVFTVFSICLYNKRKSEKCGSAYAYKFMYLFCSLLAGICGGFLVGMLFNTSVKSPSFWFFFAIGALLTAVVYGTVSNRGFKGFGKSLIMGILSIGITVAVTVTGITGGLGYTKHIPQTKEINSVTVSVFGETLEFENYEQITDLHRKIVNSDKKYDLSLPGKNIRLTYNLKGNKYLTREFTVNTENIQDELLDIYKSDVRYQSIINGLAIENISTRNIYFFDKNTREYYSVELSREEFDEFIKAYWLDVQNSDVDVLTDNNNDGVYYSDTCFELICYSASNDISVSVTLERHDSFTNANDFVKTHNLVERANREE